LAQRHLYLIRHGQKDSLSETATQGDNGLTPLGREQTERTAQRLSALPVDIIHLSTLRRAAETAEIIAAQLLGTPLRPSHLLRECIPYLPPDFIAWHHSHKELFENKQAANIPQRYTPWLDLWPSGVAREEIEQGFEQADLAFNKYFRAARGRDRHEVIVTHGNILRYFMVRILHAPLDAWTLTEMFNCGISEILIESNGNMILISHNDVGHLPYNMRTYV
jgi:serine/threonine-protein phosphatase PGAM5